MKRVLTLFLFVVAAHAAHAEFFRSPPIEVPFGHRVYDFVERLQVHAPDLPLFVSTRPYERATAADLVRWVDAALIEGSLTLSPGEIHDLAALRKEFGRELTGKPGEPETIVLESAGDLLIVDLYAVENIVGAPIDIRENADLGPYTTFAGADLTPSTTTIGGRLRGSVGGILGIGADVRNTRLQGRSVGYNFIAQNGLPRTAAGDEGGFQDAADAYVSLSTSICNVHVGKSGMAWGPGRLSKLMLSSDAHAFDHIRLSRRFGPIHFVTLHGALRGEGEPRYVAAHRIEAKVHPRLTIGGGEAVTYGQGRYEKTAEGDTIWGEPRGPQFEYLFPFFPLHVAEHYLGDHDNNVMGFDIEWIPVDGLDLSGELFIDDFNTAAPLDFYGQKLAWTTGIGVVTRHGLDIYADYSRVDPWVYTHRFSGATYAHFDRSLGSSMRPNSDLADITVDYRPTGALQMMAGYRSMRNGRGAHDVDHVASYFQSHLTRVDPDVTFAPKRFLEGTVQKTSEWTLAARWEPRHEWFIDAGITQVSIENVNLSEGTDVDFLRFNCSLNLEF